MQYLLLNYFIGILYQVFITDSGLFLSNEPFNQFVAFPH